LQICIPTTTTSTGLQAYNDHHSSLIDFTAPQAFSATFTSTMTSETMTVTMTLVSATRSATTKMPQFQLGKGKETRAQHKTVSFFQLPNDGSAFKQISVPNE
jgi:hypothetical protein